MTKKAIGWAAGLIVALGAGGYVLARYNTNSMAHVIYQKVAHTNSVDTDFLRPKKGPAKVDTDASLKSIRKDLMDENYTGAYVIARNGKVSQTYFTGKNAGQMDGKFYLATDTENMLTAAAILHLVDQGKLKLSTPINEYYSSLSTPDRVTVRSLLNMTSGLSNNSVPSDQLSNVLNWNIDHAEAGSTGQYDYQEVNYVLLEGIISQVTNQSYRSYITDTFLKPNGLTGVKFVSQIDNDKLATPYNNGHAVSDSTVTKAMNSQMGRNQLVATPKAMLRLTQFLIKNYGNNPNFTGSQPTGRLIKKGTMYYASGKVTGYRTAVAVSQDGKTGVVLMSNDSNGKDGLTALVKKLFNNLK